MHERTAQPDRGAITLSLVIAVTVAALLFVQIANLVVFQYGKGAVKSTLDEAARAGATGGAEACEATARQVLDDLLSGNLGNGVAISCSDDGRTIQATATVHFHAWLTSLTDYNATLTASAAKEDR